MADPSETDAIGDTDERDPANGRFLAGNKIAKGNPFAKRIAAYRKALHDAVTLEDIGDVARAMIQAARAGDVAAGRLMLAYTAGKPPEDEEAAESIVVMFRRPRMDPDARGDSLEVDRES